MSEVNGASTKRRDQRGPVSLPDLSRRSRVERNQTSQGRVDASGNNNGQSAVIPCRENVEVRMREDSTVRGNARLRVTTERGMQYNKSLHENNRKRAMKNVIRIAKIMEPLYRSQENVEVIEQKLLEIDMHFSEAVESHGKYHILLNDYMEREESSMWMNDMDSMTFEIKQYANNWLKDINERLRLPSRSDHDTQQQVQQQQQQQQVHQQHAHHYHHRRDSEQQQQKQKQQQQQVHQQHANHNHHQHQEHEKQPQQMQQNHFQRTIEQFTRNWGGHDFEENVNNSRLLDNHLLNGDVARSHVSNATKVQYPPCFPDDLPLLPRFSNEQHSEVFHQTRSRSNSRNSYTLRSISRSVVSDGRSHHRSRLRSNSEPRDKLSSRKYDKHSSSKSDKYNSSTSSNLSRYIEQKAKIAALKAEARFLKESQHKVKGTEEWNIDKEIAKAEAVANVYAEEEGRINSKEKKVESSAKVAIAQEPKVGGEGLENSLVKLLKLQAAPSVKIDEFDGNPLEYNYFIAAFNELVDDKVGDPKGKLTRLIQSTKGEAKELIKNCIQEESTEGYEHACALLKAQYGNPHIIARAYVSELRRWDTLKVGDSKGFRKFYSFLVKCKTCMSSGIYLKELNSPDILQVLQSKLPYSVQDKWNRYAVKCRTQKGREVEFEDFLELVEVENLVANDPMYSREAVSFKTGSNPNKNNQQKTGMQSYAVEMSENEASANKTQKQLSCASCRSEHDLDQCPDYKSLEVKGRKAFLFRKRLCFCCYKSTSSTHKAGTCTNKRKCDICGELHPTGLHVPTSADENKTTENVTILATECSGIKNSSISEPKDRISMCIVPVQLYHELTPDNVVTVYAMLDDCSDGTFITHDVLEKLAPPVVENADISITTLTGEINEKAISVGNLRMCAISGFDGKSPEVLKLPKTYTRQHLPIRRHSIPTQERIKKWKHLEQIISEIPKVDDNIPIGLLVGADCAKAKEPYKVIPSADGGPFAVRTPLGWCVSGAVNSRESFSDGTLVCNSIAVNDISTGQLAEHHFTIKEELRDNEISDALLHMYQIEFTEISKDDKTFSVEDKRFIDIMDNCARKVGNHHMLPLPLRNELVELPNNRSIALQRIQTLKRRFQKDTEHHSEYTKFMNKLLDRGYAREVTDEERSDKSVWYLPHHGVTHRDKPVRPYLIVLRSSRGDL